MLGHHFVIFYIVDDSDLIRNYEKKHPAFGTSLEAGKSIEFDSQTYPTRLVTFKAKPHDDNLNR